MNEKEKGPQDGIFDHMPLGLMMLVGVRCAAISNYATLDDEKRRRLDEEAAGSDVPGRMDIISKLERGEYE